MYIGKYTYKQPIAIIIMEKQTNRILCEYCGLASAQHTVKNLVAKKIEVHDFVTNFFNFIEEEQIQIDMANAGYSNYSLQ